MQLARFQYSSRYCDENERINDGSVYQKMVENDYFLEEIEVGAH